MSEITNNVNWQVYNAHEGDTLLQHAASVICILMPRALVTGGFNERGELLTIRYNDYQNDLPTWILDFFEHEFINEPLLGDTNSVKALYVATEKSMIVPNGLYSEEEAADWMKRLYFIESNEVIDSYPLKNDGAVYTYAWPADMQSLADRYFPQAKVLPLAAYHFSKALKGSYNVQCCITPTHVYATLYKDHNLLWHQIFHYEAATDIAYQLLLYCKENKIDPQQLQLQCAVVNKDLNTVAAEVATYFKGYVNSLHNTGGDARRGWAGTLYLLQQLYACAL